MLKLCGFHLSNYHNKVRLALLEKGIEHAEDPDCPPSQKPEYLHRSPMGKVPFLELDDGSMLAESQVICEYLEDAYPARPLYPKAALERARVRELIVFLELHLELVARRLYREVFFGGKVSDETKQAAQKELAKGVRALKARAKFAPFIAGPELTLADCAAFVHLPLVSITTKLAYGRDVLEELPQARPYISMLKQRPAFARVDAERKAAQEKLKTK